jgi:hypothetical protein
MVEWKAPPGVAGDVTLVRARPVDVRLGLRRCPQRRSLEMRPALRVESVAPPAIRNTAATTALGKVLDLVEHDGLAPEEAVREWQSREQRPPRPMLVGWLGKAVHRYLSAAETIGVAPSPVSRNWGRRRTLVRDGVEITHEEVVSGRRYEGGGVRELRLLRTGSVEHRERDDAEVALAAGVVAGASLVLTSTWVRGPLVLRSVPSPDRVRVVEIGCSDGSHNVLFDGTVSQAHAEYERAAEDAVFSSAAESDYEPGSDCGDCDLIGLCPAVPIRPGLLGVESGPPLRRSWSITTGRSFDECPARLVGEQLFLPRERAAEDTDHTRRGQAVHAWLEDQHRRTPVRACAPGEVPSTPDEWTAGRWTVSGPQARLGVQMIADHALTCALGGDGDVEAHPEQSVVVFDPEANVVVVAKTDLFYRIGDRWKVRETKTASFLEESDLLAQFPQLALAVVLSAADAFPEGRGVRVELERLAATGPVVADLDVGDPEFVAAAKAVVGARIAGWHAAPKLTATPGRSCRSCPFGNWCPERAA